MGLRGEIFSSKVSAGGRTYFFNVKENRHGDLFINLVESKLQENGGGFERRSILVFEEDLEQFLDGLQQAVKFLKTKGESSSKN
jgi:hypothetical protein